MSETGWIKLHRKLLEWGWYKDVPVYKLFTHLLLTANREPKTWKGIRIKSGQVVTGRHSLAEQTGLTEQQIRTALEKLKSTNEITISATNRSTLISIVNWQSYQVSNQESNQQITNKQPTDNHKQEGREEEKKEVVGSNEPFFEFFRRAAGSHITDAELMQEIGKFKNKYPNKHPNQAGALINTWIANIGKTPIITVTRNERIIV
jgi:hypothetical protein